MMVGCQDTDTMRREPLDTHDVLPQGMIDYLTNYGRHFNRKLLRLALSMMTNSSNGKEEKLVPYSKEDVDNLLKTHKIELKNNQLLDYVYVANMCKADFLKSSVPDEQHLAMYVRDVIDDVDGYDGIVFNRWYADTRRKGVPIDWDEMI